MKKGASYIIMWLTIFLVLILAMVLGLVLLLIAELYFSSLIGGHRRRTPDVTTAGNNSSTHHPSIPDSHITHADPSNDIEKQLLQSPENQESGETQLVYISNPIYGEGNGTPFETPESSPSRLETEISSSDDEREEVSTKVVVTPPLTPMKKLPTEARSVCLKDVRSLGMSESDTNSNNGVSSSCSLTPCTSPSL
ncbi:hypothetical protein R6Q57_029232 [Mikania cordata]